MAEADNKARNEARNKPPDWAETLEDLDRRRDHSLAMGGPERVDKHHGKGRLDARARIERLLDPGTFRELGMLVGGEIAADAIVTGSGVGHRVRGVGGRGG